MDARLDEDQPANPDFPTGVEGKTGDRLPGVPRVTLSLGAQYTLPAWWDSELVLRADASYVGSSMTRFRADPPASPALQAQLSAYTMVNLRATLRHEQWEAGAYVTNLLNTRPALDVYDFLGQTTLVTTARPRTLGLRLAYRF